MLCYPTVVSQQPLLQLCFSNAEYASDRMTNKLQLCLRCNKKSLVTLVTSLTTLLLLSFISTNHKRAFNLTEVQKTFQSFLESVITTTEPDWKANLVDYDINSSSNSTGNSSSKWRIAPGEIVHPVGTDPNPHNYAYIITNSSVCVNLDRSRTSILIIVTSHADYPRRRNQIRNTFGMRMLQTALNFRIVFLLGRPKLNDSQGSIELENYLYGDILQENFPENRTNLSLKSIMGLKWASAHCRHVDYVMKTDDDIFIHVPNLIKMVAMWKNRKLVLICHAHKNRNIVRDSFRYGVGAENMPGSFFPAYCSGFGYVMSSDTVELLYAVSLRTPYFFIEDVYITGFCRHRAKIKLIHQSAIALYPSLDARTISCAFEQGRITSHEMVYRDELVMIWEQLNTKARIC